jgi:hypothetical protein
MLGAVRAGVASNTSNSCESALQAELHLQGAFGGSTASFLLKINRTAPILNDHLSLDSISPRSRSPIEAAQAQHRPQRLLPITRRFFFDALTQGVKLLLRNPVNLGGDFHDGHGEKLCRKAQIQFVREVDVLLQRPCH